MIYTITATLNMNQNSPMMAVLTGPIRNGTPASMQRIAAPTSVFCCTGSFNFLTRMKELAPEPMNSSAGNIVLIGISSQPTLGNGRSHPPQNDVTATDETTKIFAYS